MFARIFRFLVVPALLIVIAPSHLFAIGGTTTIAKKGRPTTVLATWPKGVGDLVNAPSRTSGWNSWSSEWPNDVNQYAFAVANMDELNRLLHQLAEIESDLRQVRLSYLREPHVLGPLNVLPEGNQIPVIFSIGDQSRIDEWYKHVRKPFGQIEFTAAPIAVPPTLTIFVQNKVVKLDELKIPDGISVTAGDVPTTFHRFNSTDEKQRDDGSAQKPAPNASSRSLDRSTQAVSDKIDSFLKTRSEERR